MKRDDPSLKFGDVLTNNNDSPDPVFIGMYLGPSGHPFWPNRVFVVRDRTTVLNNWTGTVQQVYWIKVLNDE